MIDIHSHVLWGVDDGAETLEDSLELLAAAAAAGTTDIVASPHASPDYPYDAALIRERFDQLRTQVQNPVLHLGCDFHLTYDNIADALEHPSKYTIDGGRYLLVEFSDLTIFSSSETDLGRLRDAGITPVITHPERNALLRQRFSLLQRWVEQGCLLQVTASSFLGRFGRRAHRFSDQLMRAGLVHVVASDAHHIRHRPPGLQDAFREIAKSYGEPTAEQLFVVNPARILRNEDTVPVEPVRKRGLWSRLFR